MLIADSGVNKNSAVISLLTKEFYVAKLEDVSEFFIFKRNIETLISL